MRSAKIHDLLDQIAQIKAEASPAEQGRLLLQLAQVHQLSPGYLLQLTAIKHPIRTSVQKQQQVTIQIDVCQGKACRAKGAEHLLEQLKNPDRVAVAQLSQTMQRSESIVYQVHACDCLKQCGQAPVVLIDGVLKGKIRLKSNEPTENGRK